MAFGGDGVSRIDGQVVFVPFVIKGETVSIRVISEKKGILRGQLLEIISPCPNRARPICPVFGVCGGCQYQHIKYEAQTELKTKQVIDVIERIGKIPSPPVNAMIPSPFSYGYRNKITVHTRQGQTGFTDVSGAKLVPIQKCPLAESEVNDQLLSFLKRREQPDGDHSFRHLPPQADTLAPQAFYQTNSHMIPLLIESVHKLLMHREGSRVLVDAYCGAGLFAFELSSQFARIIGIEQEQKAIATALARKKKEGAGHIDFISGAVEALLPGVLAEHPPGVTTVLLDPPRTGCQSAVIDCIKDSGPSEIIYISCNPATLARDLNRLGDRYLLESVTPLDMFPQTAHIECVAYLVKKPV